MDKQSKIKIDGVLMFFFISIIALCGAGCGQRTEASPVQQLAKADKTEIDTPSIPLVDGFDYPVGEKPEVSQKRDGDGWYNAQDFGKNHHLGEDWNAESGGNSDCGKSVYAAADGLVVSSKNLGFGWGNIIILRHKLPNGELMETLYGHLQERLKEKGEKVHRREKIGTIGDAADPCGDTKPYWAHLHFELRSQDCVEWGASGGGYGEDKGGWLDPSDFIDQHRNY